MELNHIKDVKNKKIVISLGPKDIDELNDWYTIYYSKSVKYYTETILKLFEVNKKLNILMLSYYHANKKLNLVEKKKGMSGVYAQQGKTYHSDSERIVGKEGNDSIVSVTKMNATTIENLFVPQIESILCIVQNTTENELLELACVNKMDAVVDLLLKDGNMFVKFNDVGCDGNNITIFFDKLSLGLEKLLEKQN